MLRVLANLKCDSQRVHWIETLHILLHITMISYIIKQSTNKLVNLFAYDLALLSSPNIKCIYIHNYNNNDEKRCNEIDLVLKHEFEAKYKLERILCKLRAISIQAINNSLFLDPLAHLELIFITLVRSLTERVKSSYSIDECLAFCSNLKSTEILNDFVLALPFSYRKAYMRFKHFFSIQAHSSTGYSNSSVVKTYNATTLTLRSFADLVHQEMPFIVKHVFTSEKLVSTQKQLISLFADNYTRYVPFETRLDFTHEQWSLKIERVSKLATKRKYLAQYELRNHLNVSSAIPRQWLPHYPFEAIELDPELSVQKALQSSLVEIDESWKCLEHWWVGPSQTYSAPHQDQYRNFFFCFIGSKEFKLAAPENGDKIGPVNHNFKNVRYDALASNQNIADQIKSQINKRKSCDVEGAFVQAGDLLYIPKNFWHSVLTQECACCISYWL